MNRDQKIRIVSVDKRYMKEPYPFIPIYSDKLGTYMTGQHIDPEKPETKSFLTRAEMEEPHKMPDEKKKKFPYVIMPEVRIPLVHLRSFDLSTDEVGNYRNPKDAAEYNFFALQSSVVAKSKNDVIAGTHYFYIENLEKEAEVRLSNKKLRFEAESLVRTKGSMAKYKEIALVLNYKIKDFRVNINASERILEDSVISACEKYPEEVIKCFNEESERDIFILKAESKGLIVRKGNSFFDGAQYLGDTIEDIKKFLRTEDGSRYEKRWSAQMLTEDNVPKVVKNEKSNKELFDSLVEKCSKFIITGFIDEAIDFYQEAFLIDPTNEILKTLNEQIESKRNPVVAARMTKEEYKKSLEAEYLDKSRKSLIASCQTTPSINIESFKDMTDDQIKEVLINAKLELYDN